ncbi:MAG: ATP-binding cassette domain-containing protein [Acidimicrobiales bacterium]
MLRAGFEVERRDFTVRVTLTAGAGERLALYGASGAGKTTVLEAIAGLVELSEGSIELGGRLLASGGRRRDRHHLPTHRRRVGLLRQEPSLFPHMSVRANLAYGQALAPSRNPPVAQARCFAGSGRRSPGGDAARLREMAERLGIASLLAERPAGLSGGERQRVALGRALLAEPELLLLDEPFEGVDWPTRQELASVVTSETAARGVPALLVSHDLAEAQAFGSLLGVIDAGQLLQLGPPGEVFARPATRRVAELLGYRSFLRVAAADGRVLAVHPASVARAGDAPAGSVVAGCVVAGCVVAGCVVAGRVVRATPRLGGFEVVLDAGDAGELVCHLSPGEAPVHGERLSVTVPGEPAFGERGELVEPAAEARGFRL